MKYTIYLIAVAFIIFDIVSGIIKALYNGEFNSGNMRVGGFHKLSEFLLLLLIAFVQYSMKNIDIGFPTDILLAVPGYIILMEFGSFLENICAVNPQLRSVLSPLFDSRKWEDK